jgi:hypothetical protein
VDVGNYPGVQALDITTIPAPEVPMTHAMIFGGAALVAFTLIRRTFKREAQL